MTYFGPCLVPLCRYAYASDWALGTVARRPLACVGMGLSSVLLAVIGKVLWSQYLLLLGSLPKKVDLGLPFFGQTLDVFRLGIEPWTRAVVQKHAPFDAALLFFLFQPTVLISNKLYRQHVQKIDNAGELVPLFPPGLARMIGPHSMLALPAGKGHALHARIQAKCLRALAPKRVLGQLPMIQNAVGEMLAGLARATTEGGSAKFCPAVEHLTFTVSGTMILGSDFTAEIEHMRECYELVHTGMFAWPVDLGRFSAYGRGLLARRRILLMIEGMMTKPAIQRTVLGELLLASEVGAPLAKDEILDSLLTLLIAGQVTTKDTMPNLLLNLAKHPAIVEQIRSEAALEYKSVEEDSATLRFITETLRRQPPIGTFRRACPSREIDLGVAGKVPKGCAMAFVVTDSMEDDLDINHPMYADRHESHDALQSLFGGKQPHSCVGKTLALLELQIFLRELCSKYRFEIVEAVFEPKMAIAGWRNDLPVRIYERRQD